MDRASARVPRGRARAAARCRQAVAQGRHLAPAPGLSRPGVIKLYAPSPTPCLHVSPLILMTSELHLYNPAQVQKMQKNMKPPSVVSWKQVTQLQTISDLGGREVY